MVVRSAAGMKAIVAVKAAAAKMSIVMTAISTRIREPKSVYRGFIVTRAIKARVIVPIVIRTVVHSGITATALARMIITKACASARALVPTVPRAIAISGVSNSNPDRYLCDRGSRSNKRSADSSAHNQESRRSQFAV